MTLLPRAIAWFFAYVALIVTPLAVAAMSTPFESRRPFLVETSVALGFIAIPVILAQFALVSRLRTASRPFGTDALVQFHRYMGFVSLVLVLAHPLLLNLTGVPWSAWSPLSANSAMQTGAIALWAMVALVITSVVRRTLRMSYEVWRVGHLLLGIIAVVAILMHIVAVSGYSSALGMQVLLFLYGVAFGSVLVAYRVMRPLWLHRRSWTVVSNSDHGAGVRTVRVRPDRRGFSFDPGQFAWLITGRSPFSLQQHPLSISSSAELPSDGSVEFAVKGLGDWSREVIPRLSPGTRVWVEGAFGAFTTERKAAQGFILIAGGIGIAPMRSMLATMKDRGDMRHVVLLYAARDEASIPFRTELEQHTEGLNLDIVYVLEVPSQEWSGERGFVTDEILSRHLPRHFQRYHYFVCGPPPMMDAVEESLVRMGVPAGAIDSERFNVV